MTPSEQNMDDRGYWRLVYVSSATQPLERDQVLGIEQAASQKNAKVGVTGILLYRDESFMQFLEGDIYRVRSVFDRLCQDARHHKIDILREGYVPGRQFSGWDMRYVERDDLDPIDGDLHRKLRQNEAAGGDGPNLAWESLHFIQSFLDD